MLLGIKIGRMSRNYLFIRILRFLTSRISICGTNIGLIVLLIQIIKKGISLLSNYEENQGMLQNIIFNSVEFFILFGIVLEERDYLMKKIGLYPTFSNFKEDLTDEACHAYGLALLIISSLTLIPLNAISIDNDIIDTHNIDLYLYCLSFMSLFIQIMILVKFTYRLLNIQLNRISIEEEKDED